jgi:hypothetical protein
MYPESLKIEKKLKEVTLWVHPEGKVVGFLYVRPQSPESAQEEEPSEILNGPQPFVVLQREAPEGIRFYNKNSIVRVDYTRPEGNSLLDVEPLPCTLQLMDGSHIEGVIRRPLPPDRARLLDYLNLTDERFVKVDGEDSQIFLVNKPYIMCALP